MTEISTQEQATRVYISYVQLSDLLVELQKRLEMGLNQKQGHYWAASASYARSFNAILKTTREAFKIAPIFVDSIADLQEIEEALSPDILENVLSHGSKLRGTLRAFVNMYMSGEEKKRIGFVVTE